MAEANEAAPQGTEATPTPTTNEPDKAPEQKNESPETDAGQVAKFLGTDVETLEKFQKFVNANGQFDTAFGKMRKEISNPEPKTETPAQTQPEAPQAPQQPQQPQEPTSPQTPPAGAITPDEMMTQYYFDQLSKQEKYAPIAKEIADGSLLKEMGSLGIEIRNPDGSFNDAKINTYLSIKAQTVPAKPTSSDTDASSAPTVDYVNVGDEIKSMDEARAVIMQKGHPKTQEAQDFLKKALNQATDSK